LTQISLHNLENVVNSARKLQWNLDIVVKKESHFTTNSRKTLYFCGILTRNLIDQRTKKNRLNTGFQSHKKKQVKSRNAENFPKN